MSITLILASCMAAALLSKSELPLETASIQSRIDAQSAAGGGVVRVGAGVHRVGTLFLRDGVDLRLDRGCVIEGSSDIADYGAISLEYSEMPAPWHAMIIADGVKHVSISGEGEIFGNGTAFPFAAPTNRPRGIIFYRCQDVCVKGVKLTDFASWCCYFKECDGVRATQVTIDNHANVNNDGFDVESKNVTIWNCDVDAGDDGICLKSDNPNFAVENVLVSNCCVRSTCSALKFGTASHGICRNIRFCDCTVDASRRGVIDPSTGKEFYVPNHLERFPVSEPGLYPLAAMVVENVDGGVVENVAFDRIDVKGALVPVFIRAGSRFRRTFAGLVCGIPYGDRRVFRNIRISNVKALAKSATASSITGVELCRPKDVILENVDIVSRAGGKLAKIAQLSKVPENVESYPDPNMFDNGLLPASCFYLRHADGIVFSNVTMRVEGGDDVRKPIVADDATFSVAGK